MPIHSQYAAEGLKPEGVGHPREQFISFVLLNDRFRNGAAKSRHALCEPLRNMTAMQR
jgi:hypothetical protein